MLASFCYSNKRGQFIPCPRREAGLCSSDSPHGALLSSSASFMAGWEDRTEAGSSLCFRGLWGCSIPAININKHNCFLWWSGRLAILLFTASCVLDQDYRGLYLGFSVISISLPLALADVTSFGNWQSPGGGQDLCVEEGREVRGSAPLGQDDCA